MKKEITASITERGQVTVPVEVRRLLGITRRGPVSFVIEDGVVVLRRPQMTWREAYGSIKPVNKPEDWDARIEEAREERAEEFFRKMKLN